MKLLSSGFVQALALVTRSTTMAACRLEERQQEAKCAQSSHNQFPTPAVSLTEHPATLPEADIPEDADPQNIAASAILHLSDLPLERLARNVIWRDSLALTGTLRTFFGPKLLSTVWHELSTKQKPLNFRIVPGSSRVVRLGPRAAWVEARFSFETRGKVPASCSGIIGVVPRTGPDSEEGGWKIWLLSTILEQFDGFPDVDKLEPNHRLDTSGLNGPACLDGHINGDASPNERRSSDYYDCVVVGAGIGGLCMAGRLKAMNLSYMVVEQKEAIGDTWRLERYASVKLHTSREYNQMPGTPRTFSSDDPYNLSGEDYANGFQRYVRTFGINVVTSTELLSATYDDVPKWWTMQMRSHGNLLVLRARHIVLATGSMGITPKMPTFPNRDRFKGEIIHGVQWRSAAPWSNRQTTGVIVGSANTAQGIMQDMVNAKFTAVTMIQRSPTFLLPARTFSALVDPVYNEDTPTELSDRMLLGYPLPIQRLMAKRGIQLVAEQNPRYFERIESQGFKAVRNGDLWGMMYDREGGHFFDIGPGEMIANGSVKVISDAIPVSYTETGLEMSDGRHVDADVVVFATGYTGNIRDAAKKIVGDKVGESLEEFWQCDQEGESRGAWKYTGREYQPLLSKAMQRG